MVDTAEALPEKRLFIELITRDITLEDAVLDLIDNSINSILVKHEVNLANIFDDVLAGRYDFSAFERYAIDIEIDSTAFSLTDNCGGISYDAAKHQVFHFGRPRGPSRGDTLSVYGIGLKRALFKLGDAIKVRSRKDQQFEVAFSAREWEGKEAWVLPLETPSNGGLDEGQTMVSVTDLHPDVVQRVGSAEFYASLAERVRQTYCFFLERFCVLTINGETMRREALEMGSEASLKPSVQIVDENGVNTIVVAGLAPRNQWRAETAGWYIFCNGRAVLFADRSDRTGWGKGLPQYVSKFRGFRGIVFFFSEDPENLPWDTTKTRINAEAIAFQRAQSLMYNTARPVVAYLSSLYSTDEVESAPARTAADSVHAEPITRVISLGASTFSPPTRRKATTVNIQFSALISDVERVRTHLRNPTLSARKIAEMALKYYLENEIA
jgi:hypothetical protein